MNQQSLLHPFSLDYQESDYLSHERTFPNSTSLSSNECLQPPRKPSSTNQITSLPVPFQIESTNKYSHPSLHDAQFHSSLGTNPLLSPPDSTSGSISGSGNFNSTFSCSALPKLCLSNASSADQYSHASASFIHLGWNDPNMSDYPRPRALPPHSASISPPLMTFGTSGGMPMPLSSLPRPPSDPYGTSYSSGRVPPLANFNDLKHYASMSTASRPSDPFNSFPSPSSAYHSSLTMSLGETARSSQSKQEGPPFEETKVNHPVLTARHQQLMPDIHASIQKGFFQVDHKWTCYRRNYFTVSCSFTLKNQAVDSQLFIQHHSRFEPITSFAVSISAKTAVMNNQQSEERNLVQHTPKRDKATESVPQRQIIQPSPANNSSIAAGSNHLYTGQHNLLPNAMANFDGYGPGQHQAPPTSYTFERIQFQKATANNGKRRAQQQYFHVIVELSAEIGRNTGHWIVIATKQSHPMVVRGRSPGHYKDNGRKDSATSMDPDIGGGGSSGDGGSGSLSMPSLINNSHHSSSMDWTPSHRPGGYYGGSTYRHASEQIQQLPGMLPSLGYGSSGGEQSPEPQGNSSGSFSNLPSFRQLSHSPRHEQGVRNATDSTSPYYISPKKRPFDAEFFSPEPSLTPELLTNSLRTSPFEYPMSSHPKALCASS